MHAPTKFHCDMLKDVIGYLRQTMRLDLTYTRGPSLASALFAELGSNDHALAEFHSHDFKEDPVRQAHPDPIAGMADASYAPPNEKKRRSVSGRCYFHCGNTVSWQSKLQALTVGSTHASELIYMSSAADEGVWLRALLLECGFVIPSISGFYKMPVSKVHPTDYLSYAPLLPPVSKERYYGKTRKTTHTGHTGSTTGQAAPGTPWLRLTRFYGGRSVE